jgi:hypothetical protein
MSNDLTKRNDLMKRTGSTKPEQKSVATDPASRLKHEMMQGLVDRLLGKDEANAAPDNKPPRVMLALANHGRSPGWDYAKTLQRQIFDAAVGVGLQMKFAASAATMTTACAAFGLQPAGLVTQMKWRASWIGPRAIAAVMSSSAARSSRP